MSGTPAPVDLVAGKAAGTTHPAGNWQETDSRVRLARSTINQILCMRNLAASVRLTARRIAYRPSNYPIGGRARSIRDDGLRSQWIADLRRGESTTAMVTA